MRVRRIEMRGSEFAPILTIEEDIHSALLQVAAFHERGLSPHFTKTLGRRPHIVHGAHRKAGQFFSLRQVRTNQGGARQEQLPDRGNRFGRDQRLPVFADHDGIDYQREPEIGRRRGDGLHDLAVAARAGLGGVRRNVLQNRGQLGQHQFRGHAIHARQAHGVLHRQQGDHGFAVHTELMKCFQVRLDTRAADWVGAGDS